MAFIPTPISARAAITYVCEGNNMVNTLWFRRPSGYDEVGLEGLTSELGSWVVDMVLPQLHSSVSLNNIYVLDASAIDGPVFTWVAPAGEDGGRGGSVAPLNAAMTVTFKSAARGRSGRGRNYISGLSELDMTGTVIDSTIAGLIGAAYVALPTYLVGTASTHVVASHYSEGAPRTSGVTYPVTSYQANLRIYKQGARTRNS